MDIGGFISIGFTLSDNLLKPTRERIFIDLGVGNTTQFDQQLGALHTQWWEGFTQLNHAWHHWYKESISLRGG